MRRPARGVESIVLRVLERTRWLAKTRRKELERLLNYSRGRYVPLLGVKADTPCILMPGEDSVQGLQFKICAAVRGRRPSRVAMVCHRCDERRCINGEHLFWGSPSDNVRDMIIKGRSPGKSRPDTPERVEAFRTEVARLDAKVALIEAMLLVPRETRIEAAEWDLAVAVALGWDQARFRRRLDAIRDQAGDQRLPRP